MKNKIRKQKGIRLKLWLLYPLGGYNIVPKNYLAAKYNMLAHVKERLTPISKDKIGKVLDKKLIDSINQDYTNLRNQLDKVGNMLIREIHENYKYDKNDKKRN